MDPIVTAEKYIAYKRSRGLFKDFSPPSIVLICYQDSVLKDLKERLPHMKPYEEFGNLYLIEEGRVGILGGWGIGAPALSTKLEQLIALGVKSFIAVGTAGTLLDRHAIGDFILAPYALAEDGVAHLYLKGENKAYADEELLVQWEEFSHHYKLPAFHRTGAWSFSAIFRETPADTMRVIKEGCEIVEMEAATLYAIGQDKGVQTLSLFVVSDALNQENWFPHIQEPYLKENLDRLAGFALQFCLHRI